MRKVLVRLIPLPRAPALCGCATCHQKSSPFPHSQFVVVASGNFKGPADASGLVFGVHRFRPDQLHPFAKN